MSRRFLKAGEFVLAEPRLITWLTEEGWGRSASDRRDIRSSKRQIEPIQLRNNGYRRRQEE